MKISTIGSMNSKEVMAGIEFPFLEIEYVQKLNSHADDFFFFLLACVEAVIRNLCEKIVLKC